MPAIEALGIVAIIILVPIAIFLIVKLFNLVGFWIKYKKCVKYVQEKTGRALNIEFLDFFFFFDYWEVSPTVNKKNLLNFVRWDLMKFGDRFLPSWSVYSRPLYFVKDIEGGRLFTRDRDMHVRRDNMVIVPHDKMMKSVWKAEFPDGPQFTPEEDIDLEVINEYVTINKEDKEHEKRTPIRAIR